MHRCGQLWLRGVVRHGPRKGWTTPSPSPERTSAAGPTACPQPVSEVLVTRAGERRRSACSESSEVCAKGQARGTSRRARALVARLDGLLAALEPRELCRSPGRSGADADDDDDERPARRGAGAGRGGGAGRTHGPGERGGTGAREGQYTDAPYSLWSSALWGGVRGAQSEARDGFDVDLGNDSTRGRGGRSHRKSEPQAGHPTYRGDVRESSPPGA